MLEFIRRCAYKLNMNANQFKSWLKKHGCTFESKGHTGHLLVRRGDKTADLPMHGGGKELGKGLVERIRKQLGLK